MKQVKKKKKECIPISVAVPTQKNNYFCTNLNSIFLIRKKRIQFYCRKFTVWKCIKRGVKITYASVLI